MSDTNGHQAETTAEERKPPTLADIVREKTDDGRRIIDFFLDVMEDRVDGAELCHRMDAAKQLEKHKSKAAAKFLAKYRGVSCGHSIRGRRGPADPCSGVEGSPATGPLNAPGSSTQDFLTVLSAVDEDLMARLVCAQTADGSTVIEFLDDVMQDRVDGFRCHHRIAAAKELIVHIVRDEQPEPVPTESPPSANPEPISTVVPADNSIVVPATAGTHPRPRQARPEPVEAPAAGSPVVPTAGSIVVPAKAGTHPAPNSTVVPAKAGTHPAPNSTVVPAEAGTHPAPNSTVVPAEAGTHPANPDPKNAERTQTFTVRQTRRRRTRKQRRQHGAAKAAMLGKRPNSERRNKEKQDEPAPVELTIAERRIKERLQQHWHEPDPWAAPVDSTTPGRSPPW